ncbi:MAG: FAD-dependent oxidoreductase [Gaiellaceae bacterium]
MTAAGALCVALVLSPRAGLFVFWSLLVPLLPLFFLLAPGLWRNLCPMAAANQVPRISGLTRGLPLPRWLERHGYAVAALLFIGLATSRKLGLEDSGVAVAALVGGSVLLAAVGGAIFRGKSAFCGGICPLRPTQGLFGQTPAIKVAPTHCRPCVGCTPNCTDLKPSGAFVAELDDPDPFRGAYRRLFAGTLPGFTLAFFTAPAIESVGFPAVLGQLAAFSLASLGAFFVLDQLAARAAPEATTAVFAATAFGLFYWFQVPVVAGAVAELLGGEPPAWAVWEGRIGLAALALAWLGLTLRKQGGLARTQGTAIALPLAPAAPDETPDPPAAAPDPPADVPDRSKSPPPATAATRRAPARPARPRAAASPIPPPAAPPAAVAAVPPAPVAPPLESPAGVRVDVSPAAVARPTAGDPPVPIPDRRSPEPRDRRAARRSGGDRRAARFSVTVQPEGRVLDAASGSSLLDACRAADLPIEAGCQMGVCGNDPIYVLEGAHGLSPPGPDERATLERLGLPNHARMACAARVLGNVVVSFEAGVAPAPATATKPPAAATEATERSRRVRTAASKAPTATGPAVGRVVILGNGIAGVTAADHVRRQHPDCELTLVADERHDFYNRTSVSRLIYSRAGMSGMYLLPPAWYADRKIATWLNTRAVRIDRPGRRVMLGTGEEVSYDRLVLATGSRSRIPPIEGLGLEGAFSLRGADDAMLLRGYAQRHGARRAVILGGGVLGLEAADAARKLGLEATIVELSDRLSPVQLDAGAASLLQREVESRGIEVLLGRSVASVLGEDGRVAGVTLDDGIRRDAEILIVCTGVVPNLELARDAGLDVGRGVTVDDNMRTSDEAIFAAGDVAEHAGRIYGHWPAAVEQAEVAAVNAIGGRRLYTGSLIATHLKVTNVDLTSIGRPHSEPDDLEIALTDEAAGRYRKLVLKDGRIAGAILLGHPSDAGAVFAAAREGRDLSGYVDSLSRGDWEVLVDPSFEQAVSATARRVEPASGAASSNGAGSSKGGRVVERDHT